MDEHRDLVVLVGRVARGLDVAGGRPPVARGLAGPGTIPATSTSSSVGHAVGDERGGEGAQRVGDDRQVAAVADGVDDDVGVVAERRRRVVAGKVGCDDVMPVAAQVRRDELPVGAGVAGAVDGTTWRGRGTHNTDRRPRGTHRSVPAG